MGYRLIIAEDEELERTALQLIIRTQLPQYEIYAQATTGIELLEKCHIYRPDAILMDINMPALNGLDAIKQLLVTFPHLRFIVLSAHADFNYAQMALQLEYNIIQSVITNIISELDKRQFHARFQTENNCFLCITATPPVVRQSSSFHQHHLLLDILNRIKLCTKEAIAQDIGTCHVFIVSVDSETFSSNKHQFTYELRCLLSAAYRKYDLEEVLVYTSPTVISLQDLACEFKILSKKIMKVHQNLCPVSPNSSVKIYSLEADISLAISKGDIGSALSQAQLLYQALLDQSNRTPSLLCENLRDSLSALKRNIAGLECGSSFIPELCNDLLSSISSNLELDSIKVSFLHFIDDCCNYCKTESTPEIEPLKKSHLQSDIIAPLTFAKCSKK